jgi:hypothetical protein
MLREFHVPGIAAWTDSVTDEIGALPGRGACKAASTLRRTKSLLRILPITEHFNCNSRS